MLKKMGRGRIKKDINILKVILIETFSLEYLKVKSVTGYRENLRKLMTT